MTVNDSSQIDELVLTAFIDGELEPDEYERVIRAMEVDPALRQRVDILRRAGDLMRLGFGRVDTPACHTDRAAGRWVNPGRWAASLVLLFVTALVAGLGGYEAGRQAGAPADADRRLVLHISESSPAQFAVALEYTRRFVQEASPGSEIAVVANAGGLDLLRADVTRFRDRIDSLITGYEQVQFIACANSIRKLRRQGVEPSFIEHVDTSQPAFDQIVRRLEQGWSYRKVESLMQQSGQGAAGTTVTPRVPALIDS